MKEIERIISIERILLRRKSLLIMSAPMTGKPASKEQQALLVAMMKNVQALGFTFSKDLFNVLLQYSAFELEAFYFNLLPELKRLVGADVVYTPMYPNFPRQVMEMDSVELFINAIVHYWSHGKLLPSYQEDERLPLIDNPKYTVLSVGTDKDVLLIFRNLLSSKTSLSELDKSDISDIMDSHLNYYDYLPDDIPLKENVALLVKLLMQRGSNVNVMKRYCKTTTDVLRVITALSDGDISLARNTRYISLSRKERRTVMETLEAIASHGDILEDMYHYKGQWLRVAERLHPAEFKPHQYPRVSAAFNTLRNKRKPILFLNRVETAILNQNTKEAVCLLKNRPGEFARRLDKLLRDADDAYWVLNQFNEVASSVAIPVLLQIGAYFNGKADGAEDIRVFFPKGNIAKVAYTENTLKPLPRQLCLDVAKVCDNAIFTQFKMKKPLGVAYIDYALKDYLVPFSQRSASSASKSFVRGSKLPVKKNTKAIRAFIWWTNQTEDCRHNPRVDIDLSAAVYDENWHYISHVSYTQLRTDKIKAYHSGDIVDGGNPDGKGVAEFLDVDIDSAAKNGRYIVYQVYSFTGQSFKSLQNCRFGWMERESVNSGEIFEPSTVQMVSDVQADAHVSIPVIFDCVEQKAIWCDIQLSIGHEYSNNLEQNMSQVTAACYAFTHMHKANLYDLIKLNVIARGSLTDNRNGADIIFSNNTTPPCEIIEEIDSETGETKSVIKAKSGVPIITAFDTDYIMGELL